MLESNPKPRLSPTSRWLIALSGLSLSLFASCSGSDGDDGAQGPPGPPGDGGSTNTALERGDALPGINVSITSLGGGSGSGGIFEVGDRIAVRFTVQKNDGTDWDITEFSFGRILVSGPSFNYQRVIAEQSDLATAAVEQSDGSYVYTFATAIPANYLAPLNDTATFGALDGELTGQALLAGTYTVGMYFGWNYTLDGEAKRDAGDAVADFVFGSPGAIDHREVVMQGNCNQCHEELQFHGGLRRNVTLCLLCHTAGSEDRNNPNVAGGTPDVTVNFKVMIHKIHMGEHLPSVLGMSTNPDGSRNYAATPEPYQIVGFGDGITDFSHVAYPVWPNGLIAMPADQGYAALTSGQKSQEDAMRTGPANCIVCHGDPDGAGALTAPAQGDLYKNQPSQAACGSCHDDVSWGDNYTSNGQTMGAQANDANCTLCHEVPGSSVDIEEAHIHPLFKTDFPTTTRVGVHFDIGGVAEAGTNDGDGTIDAGEKVAVTLTIKDDAGADLAASSLSSNSLVISGPTSNYNLLLSTSIPLAALTGTQPYTVNVPMPVLLEFAGDSSGALDVFTTAFTPHWAVTGVTTTVNARTATSGGNSTLTAATTAPQNYVDVVNPASFARNDNVVIDDGTLGLEEYAKVQYVDGNRLWFGASGSTTYPPGLLKAHAAGATVKTVTLTPKVLDTDYSLNPATGQITELVEFGANAAVVVSYTTDFVMPSIYPMALNESPGLDETAGKWAGKPLVDGTYSIGMWGYITTNWVQFGETTAYRDCSEVAQADFLVGSAADLEPYDLISSASNCTACHQDVLFHGGGRRGVGACILCHSTSGSEDRGQYVAANAPATTGLTIKFSTMLHKIHMGEELAHASSYDVVGFGSAAYPNNFGISNYGEVVFPDFPEGVRDCAKCHGASNTAWHEPSDRNHPTDQTNPVLAWRAVCGACHDADDAQAHINVMTSGGVESCDVCHGDFKPWNVSLMHKVY